MKGGAMKRILFCFVLLLSLTIPLFAGDSHYEAYYFFSSERSEDCEKAEAWTGEAVEILKEGNPDVQVLYLPKQIEENEELAGETNAKQADLVVAEIHDGKMVRHQNIGNMLSIVDSKQTLLHIVPEGIARFSEQSESAQKLNAPDGDHGVQPSALDTAKRQIAVYVLAENAADNPDPRVADIVSEVLSREFAMQILNQMILPTIIDVDVPQNRAWVDMFQATSGDVVVAIISNNNMESHITFKGPQSPEQEQEFSESFTELIRKNINSIGL